MSSLMLLPTVTCRPLNFNTPVDLSNQFQTVNIKWKKLGQLSDSYFSFSSKIARPRVFEELHGSNTTLVINSRSKKALNCLKVVSYITVFIPLIMLISKIAFRKINNFQEVRKTEAFVSFQLIEEMPNATQINFSTDDARTYFGSFFDGSELWHVYPLDPLSDKSLLRLVNSIGTVLILDELQSDGLRKAIMTRKEKLANPLGLPK